MRFHPGPDHIGSQGLVEWAAATAFQVEWEGHGQIPVFGIGPWLWWGEQEDVAARNLGRPTVKRVLQSASVDGGGLAEVCMERHGWIPGA